jgi:hypothetical protein
LVRFIGSDWQPALGASKMSPLAHAVILNLLVSVTLGAIPLFLWAGQPATSQQGEVPQFADLYEAALRSLPGFTQVEDEIVFISMGRDEDGNYIDPTPEFLARFRDLKASVKPASSAQRVAKKAGSRLWRIEDRDTGKPGRLYSITVQERRAANEIVIDVGFVSASLGGAGQQQLYKWANSGWRLEKILSRWVS